MSYSFFPSVQISKTAMCGQSSFDILWQYWNTAWLTPAKCIRYTAITFCFQGPSVFINHKRIILLLQLTTTTLLAAPNHLLNCWLNWKYPPSGFKIPPHRWYTLNCCLSSLSPSFPLSLTFSICFPWQLIKLCWSLHHSPEKCSTQYLEHISNMFNNQYIQYIQLNIHEQKELYLYTEPVVFI